MSWLWIWLSTLFTPAPAHPPPVPALAVSDSVVLFMHSEEPKESAFSYLLPSGWITSGGVVRRDPLAPSANPVVVAPQLDFTVKKDSLGTTEIRWLPNVVYCDLHRTHLPGAELFPVGSSYQGMLVNPKMKAALYIKKYMIGKLHPKASHLQILSEEPVPELSRAYDELLRDNPARYTFHYDAAAITLAYEEGGITYKERWLTVIEDWGEMGDGQWGNKETVYYRAPITAFDAAEPVFEIIHGSLAANPKWLADQIVADSEGDDVGLKTRHGTREATVSVAFHQQQIANSIQSALFGPYSEMTRYLNPFTGTEERSPAAWHVRWVDAASDVLYSNDSTYTPNHDARLESFRFRRCEEVSDSLSPSSPIPASMEQN